ncbi:hypothetical protein AGMMS50239_39330 [Bacteroidia bacterium]|nr:hypothetical protein AGMMS50239_39330 [Bacteroidia bacterium]
MANGPTSTSTVLVSNSIIYDPYGVDNISLQNNIIVADNKLNVPISVQNNIFTGANNKIISVRTVGLHHLNYRIKDSRGAWSQTVTTYFLKKQFSTEENGIIGYEYWFKDDTKKTFKSIEKTTIANIIDAIDIVSQRKGKQIFHFCVVDANGLNECRN